MTTQTKTMAEAQTGRAALWAWLSLIGSDWTTTVTEGATLVHAAEVARVGTSVMQPTSR
jgi:hypothetical protein